VAIWKEYFFDGKYLTDGNKILLMAMLGDTSSRDLYLGVDVGFDAAASEMQDASRINEIAKFCTKK